MRSSALPGPGAGAGTAARTARRPPGAPGGVPRSRISPWCSTRISSACRMVLSRWATTRLVRPAISSAIARWIWASASASTELVASSSTRILGSSASARAKLRSCRSPTLRFRPRSPSRCPYPDGSRSMNRSAPTRSRRLAAPPPAAIGASSVRLCRMSPVKRKRSCCTKPISRAQLRRGELPDVHPVHRDPAAVRIVEPEQQVDDRGLPRPGVPDQRDRLPGRGGEGDVPQHPGPVRRVPEPDPLEADLAPHRPRQRRRARRLGHRHRLVQQGEDPLGRGHRALQQVELLREVLQRLEEAAGVLDERRQHAHREGPVRAPGARRTRAAAPSPPRSAPRPPGRRSRRS